MRSSPGTLVWVLCATLRIGLSQAFVPPNNKHGKIAIIRNPASPALVGQKPFGSKSSLSLFDFFRKNTDNDDDKKDDTNTLEQKGEESESAIDNATPSPVEAKDEEEGKKKGGVPFFANILGGAPGGASVTEPVAAATPVIEKEEDTKLEIVEEKKPEPKPEPPKPEPPKPELSPLEKAQAMQAQAQRMRLEAEKMDAMLTLEKIEKLESELAVAKGKGETTEELQNEMDALQAKLRGEAPKPKIIPAKKKAVSDDEKEIESSSSLPAKATDKWGNTVGTDDSTGYVGILSETDGIGPFNQEEFDRRLRAFEDAPGFMRKTMANIVGLDFDDVKDINGTEVAMRFEKTERKDYSFMNVAKPTFSKKMIIDMEEEIKSKPRDVFQTILVEKAGDNTTALAVMMLEDFYYEEMLANTFTEKAFGMKVETDDRFKRIFSGGDDFTEGQRTAEALFPKSLRKEGQTPTEAQVQVLAKDVLPKASFQPSSKPEEVIGGYIIRGTNKAQDGDTLMEKIDQELAKNRVVGDKLSVFYIKDFTIYGDDEVDLTEIPPVLFVTGADPLPERKRLLFTAVSAVGIGTSWYAAIFPCLLNPLVMKRTEEQMSLADANMVTDLSYLSDMAAPIFFAFMGTQLAHEAGHRVAAAVHGTNITLPTLVPSLVTGLTGTVTTFKSPPKNNDAMFDFAIAGPTTGIIASVAALYLGLQLTVTADPQTYAAFPSLPLELLRQSSLGGGITEAILGQGALSIPEAARGTAALANINVPLHPFAIGGYTGLLVNALALLPVGTTDGGRIAMTMFGRGLKLVIGQIALIVLFILGFTGADIFLFYTSYLIFFQNGNEIPAKNEFDDVSFGRVLAAITMGVVTLLTLIPMS